MTSATVSATVPAEFRPAGFIALAVIAITLAATAMLAPVSAARAQVNSSNVSAVYYNGGRFIRVEPRRWQEQGDNGARFDFEVLGPDESALYLIDRSRNVQIALDVSQHIILYSHNNEPFRELYRITAMESAAGQPQPPQQQSTTQIVTYACNEGIPLVVRYVNNPDTSLAFASHDSLPEIRMEIAPSGSGARYVNGGYELHTKGDTAIFTFNGSQDICTRG
ncbi:MAG: MliC family protein [Pseudomonadota bacterium]|nr:MliC family protein [Pseudomonadota bacterium]